MAKEHISFDTDLDTLIRPVYYDIICKNEKDMFFTSCISMLSRRDIMDCLYHYGSTNRCLGILKEHAIRMSDILKSNDYDELQIFFPDILAEIIKQYKDGPFPLQYDGQHGIDALYSLLDLTNDMINTALDEGRLSSLVICFSEEADLLSQWRGYAHDGKGLCLGFSHALLRQECEESNGILALEKVIYISESDRQSIIRENASEILDTLKGLRSWIIENMTKEDTSPDTDGLLGFNFHGMIESLMIKSLKYKHEGFKEEKEWRLFFSSRIEKNPDWIVGQPKEYFGPTNHAEIISRMRNNIEFNISEDNISPYLKLPFSELEKKTSSKTVVKELWLGPKSRISKADIELFLAQNGYTGIPICQSKTSYR